LNFSATVSAGTYIRSLAHDLGRKLGCGAHLASLRRARSGEFTLQEAVTLEQVEASASNLAPLLIPARRLLPQMPAVSANDETLARIRHGNAANLPEFTQAKLVKVFAGQELVAIASRVAGTLFQPKVVLIEQ
jgi:tRNA pseudouridine55 synthase